jgi:hypothetical protein
VEHPGASFGAAPEGPTPRVRVRRGMVLESLGDSFVGEVVGLRGTAIVLRDRRGRERAFDTVGAGFMMNDRLVELELPTPSTPPPAKPTVTASGSIAVAHRARVARGSRIFVEGTHDAELLERVWGDDLRVEGIVVEVLDGIDDLADVVRAFAPTRERRMGVLVDHLVPGSKESRIAATVEHPQVLVTGHPSRQGLRGPARLEPGGRGSRRDLRPPLRGGRPRLGRGVLHEARHPLPAVELRAPQRPLVRDRQTLQEMGVDVAIPLFEETVEWAGAINSVLLDNPRLFGQAMLLRDKALMKRRAQLGGIRVGIFEEAHDRTTSSASSSASTRRC